MVERLIFLSDQPIRVCKCCEHAVSVLVSILEGYS